MAQSIREVMTADPRTDRDIAPDGNVQDFDVKAKAAAK